MPITVTYADVEAMGALALMTGQSMGEQARLQRRADRADRHLEMLMQNTFGRMSQQRDYEYQSQLQDQQARYQQEALNARLGADMRQAQLAAEARLAAEREQSAGRMAVEQEESRRRREELEVRGQQALEQIGARGDQDRQTLEYKSSLPDANDPVARETAKRQAAFQQWDNEVGSAILQSAGPDAYRQAAARAKSHFFGSASLDDDLNKMLTPAMDSQKGYALKPTDALGRAMAGLIQAGQYGMIDEIVGRSPRHEQPNVRGQYVATARYAFESMPLEALQIQIANPETRAAMPPEILSVAEQVIRERQAQPYPDGYRPTNSPWGGGARGSSQPAAPMAGDAGGVPDYKRMSNEELADQLRAHGLSDETIRRRYPGLLP